MVGLLFYMKIEWKELKSNALWQTRGVGWGRREAQEGGDVCIPIQAALVVKNLPAHAGD